MTSISEGLADQQTAVTNLTQVVGEVIAALVNLETEIAALTASGGNVAPADLEQVASNINTLSTNLTAALQTAQVNETPVTPPADPDTA